MADLIETSTFPEGVYRIETTDPVVGGEDGVANIAPKQLASRTRWLKDQLAALLTLLGADYALKAGDYSTLRARGTTKADVGLGDVPNFAATDDASSGSPTLLATAKAVKDFVLGRLSASAVGAGAGLSGGGPLAANPTLSLGTPGTLTGATLNAVVAGGGHTHAVQSTAARADLSTATLLQARAMADHVASGDHDGRYVGSANNSSLSTDARNTRGVTRLYRADENSDYSVQTRFAGAAWVLEGFYGDAYHAPVRVAIATDADRVFGWGFDQFNQTFARRDAATTAAAGLMSAADKAKLDGVQPGAQVNAPTDLTANFNAASVGLFSSTGADVLLLAATPTEAGVMRAADKAKLDGIADGATVWPGVYTGGVADNLTFPVGTCLLVDTVANCNALVAVRIGTASKYMTAAGGALLTGTWRSRGSSADTGDTSVLVQRVA